MRSTVIVMAALAGCAGKQPVEMAPSPEPQGAEGITQEELRAHVEHLAADVFNGREAGTTELQRAGEYVKEGFESVGLEPYPGQDTFFHDFSLYQNGYGEETSLALTRGETAIPATVGAQWRPMPFSDEGEVTAEVVFAGYGITAPDEDWDDYEGLDVEGKIVLIYRYEPLPGESGRFGGEEMSEHAAFLRKAMNAVEHGAVGYLLVTGPEHRTGAEDLRLGGRLALEASPMRAGESSGPPFRAAQIDVNTASSLIEPTGFTLQELQQKLEAGLSPAEIDLGGLQATLSVKRSEAPMEIGERNVVAYLKGTTAPEELVVVGAHYDHVGGFAGDGDTIFNGADDNASGTAGLLELAQAFAQQPPERSMAFIAFSAEEKGLLGSKAWVRDFGVENVSFMLNLDMIGRNPDKPLEMIGDGYGTGMTEVVTLAAAAHQLSDAAPSGDAYFGASDHDPFYRQDVPFLFFFTGLHEDYHQLGDHADKLSYDRMERIVRTAYSVLEPIANRSVNPDFIHHIGWLGVSVTGAQVLSVEEGSRAAEAGVQVGDTLRGLSDEAMPPVAIGGSLREVEPGTQVQLDLTREGEALEVEVLRAKRGYLGVYPQGVPEELQQAAGIVDGGGVFLAQVVPEGPAAVSGLMQGDILLQIGGRPVSPMNLGSVLQRIGAGEPVTCLVHREGERIDVELTLGERPER